MKVEKEVAENARKQAEFATGRLNQFRYDIRRVAEQSLVSIGKAWPKSTGGDEADTCYAVQLLASLIETERRVSQQWSELYRSSYQRLTMLNTMAPLNPRFAWPESPGTYPERHVWALLQRIDELERVLKEAPAPQKDKYDHHEQSGMGVWLYKHCDEAAYLEWYFTTRNETLPANLQFRDSDVPDPVTQ